MITYGHFIGGKHVAGASGRTGDAFISLTGRDPRTLAEYIAANKADLSQP